MFGISDKVIVYIIKSIHGIITLVNLIAIPVILIQLPWYLSVPIVTLMLGRLSNEKDTCVLTILENKFRVKAGMPVVDTFIEDTLKYIIRKLKWQV